MQISKTENRIEKIKLEIMQIGEMRPGSLNRQYTVCGKVNCRCKDPERPKKHGPYYQLSYVHQGKSTSQFIQKELTAKVSEQLATYKRFRTLVNDWVDLALQLARENLRIDKERLAATSRQEKLAARASKSRGKKLQQK
jgi:hypothetical protein